jgi:mRNA interferase MazF
VKDLKMNLKINFNRFDVYLINLDPTVGSEIKKTRPCVIVSPDSLNHSYLKTLIIAPMTSTLWDKHPLRIDCVFQKKKGQIALDQIRAVDRSRMLSFLGVLHGKTAEKLLDTLGEMFV